MAVNFYLANMKLSKLCFGLIAFMAMGAQSFAQSEDNPLSKKTYRCESFGYMIEDESLMRLDIFKYCTENKDTAVNIANCVISDVSCDYMTITSDFSIHIGKSGMVVDYTTSEKPDSLHLYISVPSQIADKVVVSIHPYVGKVMESRFSPCGVAEFVLPRDEFKYDNYFSAWLTPVIDPFGKHTSWGDNETLSFMDLYINESMDISDPSLSELRIDITSLNEDVLSKWILKDDIVVKTDKGLFWRGRHFVSENGLR